MVPYCIIVNILRRRLTPLSRRLIEISALYLLVFLSILTLLFNLFVYYDEILLSRRNGMTFKKRTCVEGAFKYQHHGAQTQIILVNLCKRKDLSGKDSPFLWSPSPLTSRTESAKMTIQQLFRQGHHVPYLLALQLVLIILFIVFVDYYNPVVRNVNTNTAGNLSSNSSDDRRSSQNPPINNDNKLLQQLYPSKPRLIH